VNVVDVIIVALFVLAILDGWRRGLVAMLIDLAALGLGIVAAFAFFESVGAWFARFGLSAGFQRILGFILILFVVERVIWATFALLSKLIPNFLTRSVVSRSAGAAVGGLKAAVTVSILLGLLLYLPVLPVVRDSIKASSLADRFVSTAPAFERALAQVIEPAVKELQAFTTVTSIADKPIDLTIPVGTLSIDESAERELFRLANEERVKRGLNALAWDEELADVGRLHSKDMWRRQFFAHVNPDGLDPFDRMDAAKASYLVAGENLALAPTTPVAHKGLMDSPGHRENILRSEYGRLGIGAVRNGLYGVMYTQLFRN
jgi:uncharacterized protein YkwD